MFSKRIWHFKVYFVYHYIRLVVLIVGVAKQLAGDRLNKKEEESDAKEVEVLKKELQ